MKKNKLVKVKVHNYIDYILGVLLIASPWLLHLQSGSMESKIIFTIGLCLIYINLITGTKFGLVKILRVKTHLRIDFLLGLFLLVSPWLYRFYSRIYFPFIFLGLLIILNTLFVKIPSKSLKRTDLI